MSGPKVEVIEGDAIRDLRNWKEDSFNAAVVDFPWQFDIENRSGRFGYDPATKEGEFYGHEPDELLENVLFHLEYTVKPGGWLFIFADDEVYPEFRSRVEDAGWHEDELTRRQTVYWDSESMGMGYYHRVQAYPIITATVGETDRKITDRPNIYRAEHHSPSAEYPTMKPVKLYRQLLSPPVVNPGEFVIEPFAGTFPAGSVARERGFSAVGYEIREEALEIARDRIAQRALIADGFGGGGSR